MSLVRVLRRHDRDALLALCRERPVENLFVAARVLRYGVDRHLLGCDILGHFSDDGRLTGAVHVGANLVPVGVTDQDMAATFAGALGAWRTSNSIMGEADAVRWLYDALTDRWGRPWLGQRDTRWNQPLLLLDHEPAVAPDPRVQVIGMGDVDPYFRASVEMYTEEVGVSPTANSDSGYYNHICTTIGDHRGFGIIDDGEVTFKTDMASTAGMLCQLQGVWMVPRLRGQGKAAAAMAGAVVLAQQQHPWVSLYVNDYNTRALAMYDRVGFDQIGTFATVLY